MYEPSPLYLLTGTNSAMSIALLVILAIMESNLLMAWQPGIDLANGATDHASTRVCAASLLYHSPEGDRSAEVFQAGDFPSAPIRGE